MIARIQTKYVSIRKSDESLKVDARNMNGCQNIIEKFLFLYKYHMTLKGKGQGIS